MTTEAEAKMSEHERFIYKIVKNVKSQNGSGSGGEMAIYNLIKVMVECGLTTAAIGVLGNRWQHNTKLLLNDQDALNRMARFIWWGEEPFSEEEE